MTKAGTGPMQMSDDWPEIIPYKQLAIQLCDILEQTLELLAKSCGILSVYARDVTLRKHYNENALTCMGTKRKVERLREHMEAQENAD